MARSRKYGAPLISPITPIFDERTKRGAVQVGNSYSTSFPYVYGTVQDANLMGLVDFVKVGNYLVGIVATAPEKVVAIDVSSYAHPFVAGSVTSANFAGLRGIAYNGANHVFVTSRDTDRITSVDVSALPTLTVTSSLQDATNLDQIYGIAIDGSYAYFTTTAATSRVGNVNISNPAAMTLSTTLTNAVISAPLRLVKDGNFVYTASSATDRLVVVNVTNPAAFTLSGSVQDATLLDNCHDVYKNGNYCYVTSQTLHLAVVNVSVVTSPTVVGSVSLGAANLRVSYGDGIARVTQQTTDTLVAVNVSSPVSPSIDTGQGGSLTDAIYLDGVSNVLVDGGYALCGCATPGRVTILRLVA